MTVDNQTYCFVHIPKTAGSSMIHGLAELFGPDKSYFWYGDGATLPKWFGKDGPIQLLSRDHPEIIERTRIFGSHLSAGEFAPIPGEKIFITLVREPVTRALSLYEYITSGPDERHPLKHPLIELGLDRSIDDCEAFRNDISNAQCRMIGGSPTFPAAQESLRDRSWICGPMEEAQLVLDRVAGQLGVAKVTLGRRNVNQPGYVERLCGPDLRQKIAALNLEDTKLYRSIVKRKGEMPGLSLRSRIGRFLNRAHRR